MVLVSANDTILVGRFAAAVASVVVDRPLGAARDLTCIDSHIKMWS